MSTTSATFVRFGFGVPFAGLFLWISLALTSADMPDFKPQFILWVAIAALAQIIATFLLLQTFSYRNFTVGTAYSRTEPAQTALFALILFGETLTIGGITAIFVSIVGIVLISVARTAITVGSLIASLRKPAALLGLGSGTLFGLAAVGFREATFLVNHDQYFMRSAVTLCVAISLQSIVMFLWIWMREREEISKIYQAWKPALLVGFVGATASFGWFTAFTLQQAALVKVVAQVEMLFTFASSVFIFKERINRPEIIGCLLITAGIMLLFLIG